MALTITSQPGGIIPIGNKPFKVQFLGSLELVYKFNENALAGKNNYYLELTILDDYYSTTIGGGTFRFRPKSNGDIVCDISAIVRTALTYDSVGVNQFREAFNDTKLIRVVYQAFWDGGSTVGASTTSCTAYNGTQNAINAIGKNWAEYAIDENGFVYSIGQLLCHGGKIKTWYGFRFCINFIAIFTTGKYSHFVIKKPGNNYEMSCRMTQFGVTPFYIMYGFGVNHNVVQSTPNGDVLTNKFLPVGSYQAFLQTDQTINPSSTFTPGTVATTGNSFRFYVGNPKKYATINNNYNAGINTYIVLCRLFIVGLPTNSLTFKICGLSGGLPNEADVKISKTVDFKNFVTCFDGNVGFGDNSSWDLAIDFTGFAFAAATAYALVVDVNNDGFSDISNCYFIEERTTAANTGAGTQNFVAAKTAGVWAQEGTKTLAVGYKDNSTGAVKALTSVEVLDQTIENPVHLTWLNDLGGSSNWLFSYSQEISDIISNGVKRRRIRVFADGLTLNEFNMLNELNRIGTRIGDVASVGTKVYMTYFGISLYTQYVNRLEVYIVPTPQAYRTKQQKYSISLVIELPEIYNSLV